MRFWKAIGLGIGLLVIRLMMPEVFDGIKSTLLALFSTIQDALAISTEVLHHGQTAALSYPHIPSV